jgi:hypothetical protein
MPYAEVFWTNFLATFPFVLGAVLGLLPALLLVGGTVGLALRLYHQRHMARLESARQALGLQTDTYEASQERSRARYYLQSGH